MPTSRDSRITDRLYATRRGLLLAGPIMHGPRDGQMVVADGIGAFGSWPSASGPVDFASKGGPVLSAPDIKPIFWGAEWGRLDRPIDPLAVIAAMNTIVTGPYLSGLAQYGITGVPTVQPPMFVTDSEPPAGNPVPATDRALQSALQNLIAGLIDDDQLPEPDENWRRLNVVFTPSSFPPVSVVGGGTSDFAFHTPLRWVDYDLLDDDNDPIWCIWVGTQATNGLNAMDSITASFSHELVESMTDPDATTGVRQVPDTNPSQGEIADVCSNVARLQGVAVQSYYSVDYQRCIIPTDVRYGVAIEVGGPVGGATSDSPEMTQALAEFCGLAPAINGTFTYHLHYTDYEFTLTAQPEHYTQAEVHWNVAGKDITEGVTTLQPEVTVLVPDLMDTTSQLAAVTVRCTASGPTLVIGTTGTDGNYDLDIQCTVNELSDDLKNKATIAKTTQLLAVTGVEVVPPPGFAAKAADCARGKEKMKAGQLENVGTVIWKQLHTPPGDPPDLRTARLVAGLCREYATALDEWAQASTPA
jgi:hypothetical protein